MRYPIPEVVTWHGISPEPIRDRRVDPCRDVYPNGRERPSRPRAAGAWPAVTPTGGRRAGPSVPWRCAIVPCPLFSDLHDDGRAHRAPSAGGSFGFRSRGDNGGDCRNSGEKSSSNNRVCRSIENQSSKKICSVATTIGAVGKNSAYICRSLDRPPIRRSNRRFVIQKRFQLINGHHIHERRPSHRRGRHQVFSSPAA